MIGKKIDRKKNHEGVAERFQDPSVQKSIEIDLEMINNYSNIISPLEWYIEKTARSHDSKTYCIIRTIPGVGQILTLVILYEIHDIDRFPRVQDFVSYSRLVKCSKESGGKRLAIGCVMANGDRRVLSQKIRTGKYYAFSHHCSIH